MYIYCIHAGYGHFITFTVPETHKCKQHKTTTDTFWTYKYIFVFYILLMLLIEIESVVEIKSSEIT